VGPTPSAIVDKISLPFANPGAFPPRSSRCLTMPHDSDYEVPSSTTSDDDSESETPWPHDSDDNETWTKAGGGFSSVEKGGNEGDGGEPARFKPGQRAELEVKKYQKDGGYLIPKQPFRRLVGEIFHKATEKSSVTRIDKSAIEALQTISETHMSLVLNGKFPYDFD